MHAAVAQRRKLTALYLFSDIVSAYYKACRELVLPLATSSEDLDHILDHSRYPLLSLQRFNAFMQGPTLISRTGASTQLQEVLVELHETAGSLSMGLAAW